MDEQENTLQKQFVMWSYALLLKDRELAQFLFEKKDIFV